MSVDSPLNTKARPFRAKFWTGITLAVLLHSAATVGLTLWVLSRPAAMPERGPRSAWLGWLPDVARLQHGQALEQRKTIRELGRLTVDSTYKSVRVHDGVTPGGHLLARADHFPVNVKHHGAVGDGKTDDTAAIQAVLDANYYVYFPPGNYAVTQITLQGDGKVFHFDDAIMVGIAKTAERKSCVQIKCGGSVIKGLKVASALNTNYECGVHWYTNDLRRNNPGHTQIHGLRISSFLTGLVIGAGPWQTGQIPGQGVQVADGLATDAPMAECYVEGLFLSNCVRGVFMRQPNGKITLNSPEIGGESLQWHDQAENTCALEICHEGSELSILGGFLEQNQTSRGMWLRVTGGHLTCVGTVLETLAPSYIAGHAQVRFLGCQDFGFNNLVYNPFMIDHAASGILEIAHSTVNFPSGYLQRGGKSLAMSVRGVRGEFVPNPSFVVAFTGVELRDAPLRTIETFIPLVQGLRARFTGTELTSYDENQKRTARHFLDTHWPGRLSGVIDPAGSSLAPYPQKGTGGSGGWTFATRGDGTWGGSGSDLPMVEGQTIDKALRLVAQAKDAGSEMTSPRVSIRPGVSALLTGLIKVDGAKDGTFVVKARFHDFAGRGVASPEQQVVLAKVGHFCGAWETLFALVTPPKGAATVQLVFEVQAGAEVNLADLQLH